MQNSKKKKNHQKPSDNCFLIQMLSSRDWSETDALAWTPGRVERPVCLLSQLYVQGEAKHNVRGEEGQEGRKSCSCWHKSWRNSLARAPHSPLCTHKHHTPDCTPTQQDMCKTAPIGENKTYGMKIWCNDMSGQYLLICRLSKVNILRSKHYSPF